jgi:hypothetical protein
MSAIDDELATLHARIAKLEEMKKIPSPKPTVEELLNKMRESDKNNKSRKNESPIATACRFMNRDNIIMLESILDALKNIDNRLNILEKNGKDEPVYLDEVNR